MVRLSPPRLLLFAALSAAIVGLSGFGLLPDWAAALLDLGAIACYLLALRSVLPRWPPLPLIDWSPTHGMAPALLVLSTFSSAAIALVLRPGLPWAVLVPLWVLLSLSVGPWLDGSCEHGGGPDWAAGALSALVVVAPVPILFLALGTEVAAPVRAAAVGAVLAVPSWRLIVISGGGPAAPQRALAVVLVLAAAAGVSALLPVAPAMLPVAMLLGWYGLCGVAGRRSATAVGFVVLASALLAVAAPV